MSKSKRRSANNGDALSPEEVAGEHAMDEATAAGERSERFTVPPYGDFDEKGRFADADEWVEVGFDKKPPLAKSPLGLFHPGQLLALARARAVGLGNTLAAAAVTAYYAAALQVQSIDLQLTVGRFSLKFAPWQRPSIRRAARNFWMLPMEELEVPAESSKPISVQPQCHFRVTEIHCFGDLSDLYLSQSLVGQRLQTPSWGPGIPLEMFGLRAANTVKWDTCEPALSISMTVHNRSKEPKKVRFVLTGDAVI